MNNKVNDQYECTPVSECIEFYEWFGNLTVCDGDNKGVIIVNEGDDYE